MNWTAPIGKDKKVLTGMGQYQVHLEEDAHPDKAKFRAIKGKKITGSFTPEPNVNFR
jgi:hypothetical protein